MGYTLSAEDFNATFPPDRDKRKDTFEIAFALAGTVSAGAYTAGVLDYLGEALDAWEAAKERGDEDAPGHRVTIRALAGASGGALNGAIFLRAAGRTFPRGETEDNPFYASWCGRDCVTISKLLAPGTSPGAHSEALFNTSAIDQCIAQLLAFGNHPHPNHPVPQVRGYLADPLRLVVTMSNLTGTPYRVDLRGNGNTGFEIWRHDDTARFALSVPGADTVAGTPPRVDEIALSSVSPDGWDWLQEAALATCAFPIAFNARPVRRTDKQIAARATVMAAAGETKASVASMVPVWEKLDPWLQQNATTLMVDGGATNNEPIGAAHVELAGLTGSNPRNVEEACRAVILVDPFATPSAMPKSPTTAADLARAVVRLLLDQARYRAGDIALAVDDDVYSRFLIGAGMTGAATPTLASGSLGAFGGFLDRELLKHDFALGRYDAYLFLTRSFRFDPLNVIFANAATPWTPGQINIYTTGAYIFPGQKPAEIGFLPMIPLMESLRENPPRPPPSVPKATLPKGFDDQIAVWLDGLFERVLAATSLNFVMKTGAKGLWKAWGRSKARGEILKRI
ncbi:patatin-like phospholipase family protein [Mesorhizobium sp. BR1-1-16]|uniref:patatin-like phospholipase family protein n=1 Tax=Mesorhizobium sp. BR1-1-16 TaxID=2876653 RepID=UPI001CCC094E|nr:patatin-like phospholipase family protein [Mesorhizobium sp. BR1-1-16]MBZ9938919.1 patatin-like phospholipase family protein [Mesorhizobium sp. BR1-1-16]